jgi:PKHD-type hydroxylase
MENTLNSYKTFFWGLEPIQYESIITAKNIFNNGEIEKIIELGESGLHATVLGPADTFDPSGQSARDCSTSFLYSSDPANAWLFAKLAELINDANKNFYHYDLSMIETLQFTKYVAPGQHYKKHVDILARSNGGQRKISFTVQLSDSADYDGGDLIPHVTEETSTVSKEKGTIHLFPSYMMHEVTPVTRGVRYSLVGWVLGPAFK